MKTSKCIEAGQQDAAPARAVVAGEMAVHRIRIAASPPR
jgi:hypothetical protein